MRLPFLLIALLLVASPAHAASYVLQCTASCTASDGTTQPAGTVLGTILWDGSTPYTPPAGIRLIPYAGQPIYTPAVPAPTTMPLPQFMLLLTQAQRLGLWAKMVSDTTLADDYYAWMNVVTLNGGIVDATQPTLAALLAHCVSSSYLTQAQANALLALQ